MNKKTMIIIAVVIVFVALTAFFVLSKKNETKPATSNIPTDTEEKRVMGYTREELAQMQYSKADLDLMFV